MHSTNFTETLQKVGEPPGLKFRSECCVGSAVGSVLGAGHANDRPPAEASVRVTHYPIPTTAPDRVRAVLRVIQDLTPPAWRLPLIIPD